MLRLGGHDKKANPQASLEPDRRGTLLGLSLTGFHEVAYVDWGPVHAGVPVMCVHGLSRQGAISTMWPPSLRRWDDGWSVRSWSDAAAAASCAAPTNMRSRNIALT